MFNDKKGVNKNVRLLMSDTDSLVYHIVKPINKVYSMLKDNPWMDFSNYKSGHFSHFYSKEKYLTPGFMKDESNGMYIYEFVGSAAKAYSILLEEEKEKQRLKGVKRSFAANHIKHEQFLNAVLHNEEHNIEVAVFNDITSKHHQLRTVSSSKTTLVPYNDKKYFTCTGAGKVYSFGHKDIPTTPPPPPPLLQYV